jgi:hypothetical protein
VVLTVAVPQKRRAALTAIPLVARPPAPRASRGSVPSTLARPTEPSSQSVQQTYATAPRAPTARSAPANNEMIKDELASPAPRRRGAVLAGHTRQPVPAHSHMSNSCLIHVSGGLPLAGVSPGYAKAPGETGMEKEMEEPYIEGVGSSRQGCDPAGESPAVPIVRVGHVATPHLGPGNRPGDAWCERPGRSAASCRCGGSSLGA